MELFDTHCHLDLAAFDGDRTRVLDRARRAGVTAQLLPAVSAAGWNGLRNLCAEEPGLYPALGLHPVYLDTHRAADLEALERSIAASPPVAIGEIGLDFFLRELDPGRQQALFEAQLGIAREARLPVVIHVRKAHDQVLQTLRRIPVQGGTIHAFNGSLQQAREYIERGFKLGFGGMLTFPRSTRIRRLAKELPLDALVLETDAPDLTVASHRGQRNSPEYLPEVLAALAEIRGAPAQEIAERTTRNVRDVFNL